MTLRSVNPTTEEVIHEVEELNAAQIEQKLALAQATFEDWRKTGLQERAKLMKRVASTLRTQKSQLAQIITGEVGKTLAASEAEIEKCAVTCDFYAEEAATFLQPEVIKTDATNSYVRFDPIGVVLAVMPWNFPFWQVFRFLAPALMAGNVGVLKHASSVQLSAAAIEKVLLDAGLPEGVFLNLAISSAEVEAVINDKRIMAVTLTGSEHAGSQVAKAAGKAIKKTVLELGGSDPFIVLRDADLDAAAHCAVVARLQANAGQSCIAAKRFIIESSVAETFIQKTHAELKQLKVGDPTDAATAVGPLANEQMLKNIQAQVDGSVSQGAVLVYGGERIGQKGYFYSPTLVKGVKKGMPLYDQEVFGPAIAVITVANADEAVAVANDSQYGLGATIFSQDTAQAEKLAQRIESGSVFINHQVKSDARLPFGGVKQSGYGRELSHYGIKEFVNIKTVWIK